jgi:hypothetical protein
MYVATDEQDIPPYIPRDILPDIARYPAIDGADELQALLAGGITCTTTCTAL